jgi:hypothetical protein
MRCQNCSAENPQGAKFCIQCAAPLQRRCQRCGFDNPAEAKFCAQCAASLVAPAPIHTEAEPRARGPTIERRHFDGAVLRLGWLYSDRRAARSRGIALAQKMGAKAWELRANMSPARLLRDTGRRDEARAMLAEIYDWFTEGFDTADLKDTKALLDKLHADL